MAPVQNIWKGLGSLLLLLVALRSAPESDSDFEMSFIKVSEESDFSYHNLPYGVFSTHNNVSKLFISGCFCWRERIAGLHASNWSVHDFAELFLN